MKRGGTKGKHQRRPSRALRGLMRRNGGGYTWSPGPAERYFWSPQQRERFIQAVEEELSAGTYC